MKNVSVIFIYLLFLAIGCSTTPVRNNFKVPQPLISSSPNSTRNEKSHSTSKWMQNMWMK